MAEKKSARSFGEVRGFQRPPKATKARQLVGRIIEARSAIRWHRDQRGHYRCWLDDLRVYEALPDYENPFSKELCSRPEFLDRCEQFWNRRQAAGEQPQSKVARKNPEADADLEAMSIIQLRRELDRLLDGVRSHRSAGEAVTWRDDAALYRLLPERIFPITALPDRVSFLRGCKRFYTTRGRPPKLHEW